MLETILEQYGAGVLIIFMLVGLLILIQRNRKVEMEMVKEREKREEEREKEIESTVAVALKFIGQSMDNNNRILQNNNTILQKLVENINATNQRVVEALDRNTTKFGEATTSYRTMQQAVVGSIADVKISVDNVAESTKGNTMSIEEALRAINAHRETLERFQERFETATKTIADVKEQGNQTHIDIQEIKKVIVEVHKILDEVSKKIIVLEDEAESSAESETEPIKPIENSEKEKDDE